MTWLWIPFSIGAAAFQCVRSATQKHLTSDLSAVGASLVRFLFGAPFTIAYLLILMHIFDRGLPPLTMDFLLPALGTAITQIFATFLLVYSFSLRNFAVATTYARTESFQTALFGVFLFGEVVLLLGWVGIAISVIGVILITLAKTGVSGDQLLTGRKSALCGIAAGAGFAFASLFLREASLSFGDDNFLFTAALTLATVQIMQIVLMGGYVLVTDKKQITLSIKNWKRSTLAGLAGTLGSVGWFTAMTLEQASYVKAVGQIEFVFTLLVSLYFFKEKSSFLEVVGMVLVVLGIIILLVGAQ